MHIFKQELYIFYQNLAENVANLNVSFKFVAINLPYIKLSTRSNFLKKINMISCKYTSPTHKLHFFKKLLGGEYIPV